MPIPFDESSTMHTDLLSVEFDGAKHLADPAAHRRDRRKGSSSLLLNLQIPAPERCPSDFQCLPTSVAVERHAPPAPLYGPIGSIDK